MLLSASPITPVPGTPIFDEALATGKITMDEFDDFDEGQRATLDGWVRFYDEKYGPRVGTVRYDAPAARAAASRASKKAWPIPRPRYSGSSTLSPK